MRAKKLAPKNLRTVRRSLGSIKHALTFNPIFELQLYARRAAVEPKVIAK